MTLMMKPTHILPFSACCLLVLFASGCRSFQEKHVILFPGILQSHASPSDAAALFAELGGEDAFLDLARYLYRWYLDENDLEHLASERQQQLWVRRVQMVGDEKDNSRYLELVFPAIGVAVTLKKTDYQISELRLTVKSAGYRVIRLNRDESVSDAKAEDYAVLDLDIRALYDRLFQSRLDAQFPGEALEAHVTADLVKQCDLLAESQRGKVKTFCFAPVLAVGNEVWVFWEEGKLLFRYSSDIDLANPEVWTFDAPQITVIDAAAQTVVSFEEQPGDRRFVTRDQVGRALYNCLILGKRKTLPPR